jgi:hypothetical protein
MYPPLFNPSSEGVLAGATIGVPASRDVAVRTRLAEASIKAVRVPALWECVFMGGFTGFCFCLGLLGLNSQFMNSRASHFTRELLSIGNNFMETPAFVLTRGFGSTRRMHSVAILSDRKGHGITPQKKQHGIGSGF